MTHLSLFFSLLEIEGDYGMNSVKEKVKNYVLYFLARYILLPLSKIIIKIDVSNTHPLILLPLLYCYGFLIFAPFLVALFTGVFAIQLCGTIWLGFNLFMITFRDSVYDSEAIKRAYIGFKEDFMGSPRQKEAAESYVDMITRKRREAAEREMAKTKRA